MNFLFCGILDKVAELVRHYRVCDVSSSFWVYFFVCWLSTFPDYSSGCSVYMSVNCDVLHVTLEYMVIGIFGVYVSQPLQLTWVNHLLYNETCQAVHLPLYSFIIFPPPLLGASILLELLNLRWELTYYCLLRKSNVFSILFLTNTRSQPSIVATASYSETILPVFIVYIFCIDE